MYKRAVLEQLLCAACGVYRVKQAAGNGNFTGGRNQVNEIGAPDPTGQTRGIAYNYGRLPANADTGYYPNAVQNTYSQSSAQQNANRAARWQNDPYGMLKKNPRRLRGSAQAYDSGLGMADRMRSMRNNPYDRSEQEAIDTVRAGFPALDAQIQAGTEPMTWLDPLN